MNKKTISIVAAVVLTLGAAVGLVALNKKDTTNMSQSSMQADQSTATKTTSMNDMEVKSGTVMMDIKDFDFQIQKLRIKPGTTVTWTNRDSAHHDVFPDQKSADFEDSGKGSGKLLSKGESYSYTFQKAGTYNYHCTPHPYMKASVEVVE